MHTEKMIHRRAGEALGIASVPNLRDLGGYKTRDGATVAKGLVYRSNQLAPISPSDMEKLAQLGLKMTMTCEPRPSERPFPISFPLV